MMLAACFGFPRYGNQENDERLMFLEKGGGGGGEGSRDVSLDKIDK